MEKSRILLCAALCVFVYVTAEDWSGNVCSRQDFVKVTKLQCSDSTLKGCITWKNVSVPQYVTVYYCCPGWMESSSQNCDVPICNPPCKNGTKCTSPNVCSCSVQCGGLLGAHGQCTNSELDSVLECITPFNDKFFNAFSGNQGTQCNRDLITDDLCSDYAQIVTCGNEKNVSDTECRPFVVEQINEGIGIPCKIEDFAAKCTSAPALNEGPVTTTRAYTTGEMTKLLPFFVTTTSASTSAQCPAGHFINAVDNGRCTQCAVGRYQERANQNGCKKCPAGSTTNTTGARDIQACRAPPQMKSTASVHLRYVLLVICTREDEVQTSSAVHARVVVMQSDWTGLCNDSACSNSHVTSTCEGPTSKIITSVIAFDDISPTLSSTNTSTTLPTNEALLQAILLSDTFDLRGITGAVLSKSDVSVTVTYSCRAGYVPSSDTCVAVSGGGISPELIGSIVGGCIGLIAVILLVILVIRQFRKPRTQRETDRPATEHPYDSLTSPAVGKPYTELNSPPVPHSWHRLDPCAPNRPSSERKSESFPQQETVSDYDYLELQETTKHVYLTPAGMPATLQEMTSSPDQELTPKPELPSRTGVTPLSDNHLKLEDATMDTNLTPVGMPATLQDMTSKSDHEMTSKPELPSRTGVTPLSDRQGRGDLGSNDTAVEMASAAPPDTTPTAHTLAAESDYITPIF